MELILGKDVLAFFRRYKDRATQDAGKIRFQTEHSVSMEKENESEITKDGVVNTITDGENTAEFTSYAYMEDGDTVNMWKELKKWYRAGDLVEFWQVFLGTKNDQDQYDVEYFQGYFTSFELSASADGKVELTYSFAINGNGVEAKDSLTEKQKAAIKNALYEYHTLAKEDQI